MIMMKTYPQKVQYGRYFVLYEYRFDDPKRTHLTYQTDIILNKIYNDNNLLIIQMQSTNTVSPYRILSEYR